MNSTVKIVILTIISVSVYACKNEVCNNEHFGSISITNQTEKNLVFIAKAKDVDIQNTADFEIMIKGNDTYVWENFSSGETEILVYDTRKGWATAESFTLSDCENPSFTYSKDCELYKTATAYVLNKINQEIIAAIRVNGIISNEAVIPIGGSQSFAVKEGELIFLAKLNTNDAWQESETEAIEACGIFSFTWTANKVSFLN